MSERYYTASEFDTSSSGFTKGSPNIVIPDVRMLDTLKIKEEQFRNASIYRVTKRGYISDNNLKALNPIKVIRGIDTGGWSIGYEYNQPLSPHVPQVLTSDSACYQDMHKEIKLDDDVRRDWEAMGKGSTWINNIKRTNLLQLRELYTNFLTQAVLKGVDATNKGNKAGKYKTINLGSIDKPVAIDKDNIYNYLQSYFMLFSEMNTFHMGDMFIILPVALQIALTGSPEIRLPNTSIAVDAITKLAIPPQVSGFKIYFDNIAKPIERNQSFIYPVIAGQDYMVGINDKIVTEEVVRSPEGYFDELRIRARIGIATIDPTAVAIGYISTK